MQKVIDFYAGGYPGMLIYSTLGWICLLPILRVVYAFQQHRVEDSLKKNKHVFQAFVKS